jgi:pilus assembly protein Flp/PilA
MNLENSCSGLRLFDLSWIDKSLVGSRLQQLARAGRSPEGRALMNKALFRLHVHFQDLRFREDGQDLVEYALMLTLISLALISGMSGIASAVKNVFSNISNSLA